MYDFKAWLIGSIALDIGVIISNVGEQILIGKKWKHLHRMDHLLLSLSISDLISGITTLIIDSWYLVREVQKQNNITRTAFTKETQYIISRVFDSVFLFSVFAAMLHVIAIAVERLCAVKFPTRYYIFNTFTFKCRTLCAIWIVAVLLTPTFSVLTFLSLDRTIGTFIRGAVFAIIIALVFLVYLAIACLLLQQRRSIDSNVYPEMPQDRLKRQTILSLFIGIIFVICMIPMTLAYLNRELYHPISNVMITLNSIINPCIYYYKAYFDWRNLSPSQVNIGPNNYNNAAFVHRSRASTVIMNVNAIGQQGLSQDDHEG